MWEALTGVTWETHRAAHPDCSHSNLAVPPTQAENQEVVEEEVGIEGEVEEEGEGEGEDDSEVFPMSDFANELPSRQVSIQSSSLVDDAKVAVQEWLSSTKSRYCTVEPSINS
jgi:hypothetical protein